MVSVTTLLLWLCNWSTLGVCAALKLPQISAVLGARQTLDNTALALG